MSSNAMLSLACLTGLTAAAFSTVTAVAQEEPLIGFITQLSEQQYFVDEAEGAQAVADELGIRLQVVDSGLDSDKVMNLARSLGTQGAEAIIVVPSNTDVGPALADIAAENDMHLVASDSPLEDAAGNPVPFVGLDNAGSGRQVGEILVREFGESGWSPESTYFGVIEAPFQACLDRTDTALEVFRNAYPDLPDGNVVTVPYEGLVDQADNSMRATLTAHPEAEHWLLAACNDEGVVGALQALEARAFPVENVIGVGLGATQSCLAFTTDYIKDGFRASTNLNPASIGGGAVRVAVALINGEEVPDTTFVETPEVTIDNFSTELNCD